MQQTTNLGLNKPDYNDTADIGVINSNMDIIDEKITELQSGSGVKIYTTTELSDPQEAKIYNVKIEENTSTINEKPVYKENTSESVTLKAGKVATVYFSGGNFFYKASASGNATSSDVLADKKFSNDDDTDITGTMPNHGGKIFKPSNVNIIITKGFHNGTGYVEGDPNLVSGNIVQGKQIFGVDGSALEYTAKQKEDIANAITSKGVATSTTASWSTIEQNIRRLSTVKLLPIDSGRMIWSEDSYYGASVSNTEFRSARKEVYEGSWFSDPTHLYFSEPITYVKYKQILVDPSERGYVSGEFFLVPFQDLNLNKKQFADSIKASASKIKCANNKNYGYINVPNNTIDYRLVFLCGSITNASWYQGALIFGYRFPYFLLLS